MEVMTTEYFVDDTAKGSLQEAKRKIEKQGEKMSGA